MITSKHITNLVEVLSKVPVIPISSADILDFVNNVKSYENIGFAIDKSSNTLSLFIAIRVARNIKDRTRAIQCLVSPDFIESCQGLLKQLKPYFGSFSFDNNSRLPAIFWKSTFHESKSELTMVFSDTSLFVDIQFEFPISIIGKFPGTPGLSDALGRLLHYIAGQLSRSKENSISTGELDELVSEFVAKIQSKTSIPIREIGGNVNLSASVDVYCDFKVTEETEGLSVNDYMKVFLDTNNDKLRLPIKNIERLLDAPVKPSIFSSRCIFSVQSKLTKISVLVALYGGRESEMPNHNIPKIGPVPAGKIRLVVSFYPIGEIAFLPGFSLDDLADAIANIFVDYKRLIDYFVNRPTKKTNANW